MIAQYLSPIVPPIADHLWQSTLFAFAVGVLTLALRKNRAGVRYWLWLAASLKFLLPFSLLSAIGSRLAFLRNPVAPSEVLSFAVEVASKPFSTQIPITRPAFPVAPSADSWVFFVAAIWLTGFLAILIIWYLRWRRISAAIRESKPLSEGRELEALRRVEINSAARIEMLLSRASLEPGIFGILRPVMVWPEGISIHLEDAHLEAILTHELWHVRRRDNLAAAVHMVVEALFWFHPLVWWLGARLVEERERACDEEVLELGGERQIYAESILKVCEFCVGSPLACVAGVTGSDLKKRIVHIMTKNVVRKLDFSRKLLLSVSGLVAVALPVGFGLMHATPGRAASASENVGSYKYQVTSLKPSKISPDGVIRQKMLFKPEGMSVEGVTPGELVREAYELGDNQISGAPDWVNSTRFDIEASADKATADELMKLNQDQQALATRRMRQALIADAFKLAVHAESKNLQQYTLVVANGGAKLQVAKIGEGDEDAPSKPGELQHLRMMRSGPGELTGQGLRTTEIASLLSRQLGATVTDQTGLKGIYEINLHWIATEGELPMDNAQHLFPPEAKVFSPAGSQPSLSTALQEQLGLELKSQIGPVLVIAIDHVERPGAN